MKSLIIVSKGKEKAVCVYDYNTQRKTVLINGIKRNEQISAECFGDEKKVTYKTAKNNGFIITEKLIK
jgi:hypothetical protein